MKDNDYRYATLRYSAKIDRMVAICDDNDPLAAVEPEDFAGLSCGRPLEYLAIKAGAAEWVPSRIERRDEDSAMATKGWYLVGLDAPIEGRAVRFRM